MSISRADDEKLASGIFFDFFWLSKLRGRGAELELGCGSFFAVSRSFSEKNLEKYLLYCFWRKFRRRIHEENAGKV